MALGLTVDFCFRSTHATGDANADMYLIGGSCSASFKSANRDLALDFDSARAQLRGLLRACDIQTYHVVGLNTMLSKIPPGPSGGQILSQ